MFWMDIGVVWWSSVSYSSFSLMTSNADFTGIEVKKAETSYEMMHSPSCSLIFLMSSANSLELLTWWMEFPVRGFKILASSFVTPYVTELLLDTIGLSGLFFLWILGSPYSLGELAPVGYIFLYVWSSHLPSVLILLRMLISLFFHLLVGSIFRGLKVVLSCSSSFIFWV